MTVPHSLPPKISGYTYVRPLGTGGFATVHLYEQNMPRRMVALKVLDPTKVTFGDGEEMRRVFEHEADTMALLSSHPSIVSIYEASVSLEGTPYFTMEYCPESMGSRTNREAVPLDVLLDVGVRMAGALETAHRAKVLHRDVKPSNVLLNSLGRPVLSDFGISHLMGQELGDAQQRAMSIPWSAPEVVTGTTTGTIASEVWSMGATLYTFAAGRSPFARQKREENSRAKITARITRGVYTAIPGVFGYEPLDEVLSRAMRRKPEQRFTTMQEFGEALQSLQRHYGFDVTPLEIISPSWAPQPALAGAARGPVVSSVGRVSRAEARAELLRERGTDTDGLLIEDSRSGLGRGIAIGVTIGAAAMAIGAVALWGILGGGW